MKRITLLEGIAVAAALAGIGLAASFILSWLFAWPTALKANIAWLTLLYLGYLFYNSGLSAGKVILSTGSAILLSLVVFLLDTPGGMATVAAGMIGLLRALLFASGVLGALAHLILCLLGAGCAGYVLHTNGGLGLAVWSFFLAQAPWVLLPRRTAAQRPPSDYSRDVERFERAHANADAALKQMLNRTAGKNRRSDKKHRLNCP